MKKLQDSLIIFQSVGPTKHRYRAVALFAGQNIYTDLQPTTKYEWKCDQLANKLFIQAILSTMLALVSHILIIVGPLYVFIVQREYVTPTGVIFPFMDPNSRFSFLINMSIQSASAFIALINMVGLEIVNGFIINSFTAMTALVCFNM